MKDYKFPKKVKVRLSGIFEDKRGKIFNIANLLFRSCALIKSKKNSIRANHYHKKDYHVMYVVKGEIDYFYKKIKGKKINYIKVKKNELIYTPPMEIHATYFPKNTVLIVSSKNPRDQATYEKDTVRVEMINKENIIYLLKKNAW